MCRFVVLVSSALLVLSPASMLPAQISIAGYPSSSEDDSRLISLIRNPDVLAELALAEGELKQTLDLTVEMNNYPRQLMQERKLGDLDDAARAEISKEYYARQRKVVSTFLSFLDDKQRARLSELRVQSLGPEALLDSVVADRLQLTAAQRDELDQIKTEYGNLFQQSISIRQGNQVIQLIGERPKDGGVELAEKSRLKAERLKTVVTKLTAEQKMAWDALQGPKFDFARNRNEMVATARAMEIISLMAIEVVQDELGFTTQQRDTMKEIQAQSRPQQLALFGGNVTPEERQRRMQAMRNSNTKAATLIMGLLDQKQAERFEQLRLQRQGIRVLVSRDMIEKLKLTPDQTLELNKIFASVQGRLGREDNEKTIAAAIAVLNEEQKAAFDAMQGKKFVFPVPGQVRPKVPMPNAT